MMNADFTMGKQEILSPVTDNTSTELQDIFEISPEDLDLVAGGWHIPHWVKSVAEVAASTAIGGITGAGVGYELSGGQSAGAATGLVVGSGIGLGLGIYAVA